MCQPILERLALDRDRREVREESDDAFMFLIGLPRLAAENVEGAEHGVAVAREDGRRPARVQPVLEREVATVRPQRIRGDVRHDDGGASMGGRPARAVGRADRGSVQRIHETRCQARRNGKPHRRSFRSDEEHRARQRRKMVFDGRRDRLERFS